MTKADRLAAWGYVIDETAFDEDELSVHSARQSYRCKQCEGPITKGMPYVQMSQRSKFHLRCASDRGVLLNCKCIERKEVFSVTCTVQYYCEEGGGQLPSSTQTIKAKEGVKTLAEAAMRFIDDGWSFNFDAGDECGSGHTACPHCAEKGKVLE